MLKNNAKVKRSQADLRAALIEQVDLLLGYCEHVDRGESAFAKPMATAVRVLLHQSPSSHSILHQLGLRSGRYFSMAPPLNPHNILSECNLVSMRIGATDSRFLPVLHPAWSTPKRVPFPEWWTRPVAKAQDKRTMSRMDIVRAVADMDGGAHVDSGFTEIYAQFRSGEFLGWRLLREDQVSTWLTSPQYSCIRTIAHELLLSLHKYSPWCFSREYTFPTDAA